MGRKFDPNWPSAQADTPEAKRERKRAYDARQRSLRKLIKQAETVTGKSIEVILQEVIKAG